MMIHDDDTPWCMMRIHKDAWWYMLHWLQMGFGVAADYVLQIGIEAIWDRVQHLANLLRKQLSDLPGATVQDRGRLLCGIVSFTMVSTTWPHSNDHAWAQPPSVLFQQLICAWSSNPDGSTGMRWLLPCLEHQSSGNEHGWSVTPARVVSFCGEPNQAWQTTHDLFVNVELMSTCSICVSCNGLLAICQFAVVGSCTFAFLKTWLWSMHT